MTAAGAAELEDGGATLAEGDESGLSDGSTELTEVDELGLVDDSTEFAYGGARFGVR